MKKGYVVLLIFGLILLFATLTNPSPERHKEAVKTKFKEYMQKSMKDSTTVSEDENDKVGLAFGMIIGNAIIEPIVNSLISTDNYIVFSTTKITWDGKTTVIGIGAFGNVFITKKIDNTLDQGLLESIE